MFEYKHIHPVLYETKSKQQQQEAKAFKNFTKEDWKKCVTIESDYSESRFKEKSGGFVWFE